jgi:hypothetical protein
MVRLVLNLRQLREDPAIIEQTRPIPRAATRGRGSAEALSGNRPFTIPYECARRVPANWRVKQAARDPALPSLAFA